MKPRVAITVGPDEPEENDRWRPYRRALAQAGAESVFIHRPSSAERIAAAFDAFDGLLIPGGKDIAPEEYGGRPSGKVRLASPKRDELELHAIRHARLSHLPALGICRGIQAMNVALGGTLYEDIGDQYEPVNGHKIEHQQTLGNRARGDATHPVDLLGHSKLYSLFGAACVITNSMHHQALRRVAYGLIVTGKSRDGIVEAVELRDHPFFIGVQWHPEEMVEQDEPSRKLFREFVLKAADHARLRSHSGAS